MNKDEKKVKIGDEVISPMILRVTTTDSLSDVMRFIDEKGNRMAVVCDSREKMEGIVTDGDIRRKILTGVSLNTPVERIMNKNPLFIKLNLNFEQSVPKEEIVQAARIEVFKKTFIDTLTKRIKHGIVYIPLVRKNDFTFLGAIPLLLIDSEIKDRFPVDKLYKDFKQERLRSKVKKILIIGGAGYVGTHLVKLLINSGFEVRILDNFLWGQEIKDLWEDKKHIDVINGDVRHIEVVVEAMKGMDAVCHLAAIVGDPACDLDYKKTLATNYLSTVQIAETCKLFQINRVIFASTCSVYGASKGKVQLKESSPLNPVSTYARTKIDGERAFLEKADKNFAPTIFRMATIYGDSPRMRFDLVVNLLAVMAYYKEKITIFGGNQWRPFLHVEDAARAYLQALTSPISQVRGQIFNLGSTQENYQIKQIGDIIKEFLPQTEIIVKKDIEDPRNYYVDFTKVTNQMNFQTNWTVRTGIQRIIHQLKQGKYNDWESPKYSNYKQFKEILRLEEDW